MSQVSRRGTSTWDMLNGRRCCTNLCLTEIKRLQHLTDLLVLRPLSIELLIKRIRPKTYHSLNIKRHTKWQLKSLLLNFFFKTPTVALHWNQVILMPIN